MPEWVDSFGAHAYPVSQPKHSLPAGATRAVVRLRHDGMVAVAINAPLPRRFLETVDADQAFDEDLHEFDEESEFLHGYDQSLVLLAQVAFHELRRLPIHQFALGGIGA